MSRDSDTRTRGCAASVPPSAGMAMTFRCAACTKFKFCTGRKLRRVLGLRQYVCAECADRMAS